MVGKFVGTVTTPIEYRVDALQTIWTSNPANSIFAITRFETSYSTGQWSLGVGDYTWLNCPRTANGSYSLQMQVKYAGTGNSPGMIHTGSAGLRSRSTGVALLSLVSGLHDPIAITYGSVYAGTIFENGRVDVRTPANAPVSSTYTGGGTASCTIDNYVFDGDTAPSAHTAGALLQAASVSHSTMTFVNCKFNNFVSGSRLTASGIPASAQNLVFMGCQLGNMDLRGPTYSAAGFASQYRNTGIFAEASDPTRDFIADTWQGCTEWNSKRSFPTLNATLQDGVTPWSLRVVPATAASASLNLTPYIGPLVSKVNSLSSAARTITAEIAIADTLTFSLADISMVVTYASPAGVQYTETTYNASGGSLTASTSTWSAESGGKVSFVDGGTVLHNKFKLQLTTANSIASGSIITVMFKFHKNVTNTTQAIFIDPEVQVT
jgi:hypothetical protein